MIFEVTIIEVLKWAVEKIRKSIVLESCAAWTNRLHRISQSNENYLSS